MTGKEAIRKACVLSSGASILLGGEFGFDAKPSYSFRVNAMAAVLGSPSMRIGFVLFFLVSAAFAQLAPQNPEPAPTPMELPMAPVGEVFAVQDPEMITSYQSNATRVKNAVERLVMAVTNQASTAAAWGSLVKPTDRVGLKISAVGLQ